jgi:hypothetical protein
VPDVLCCLHQRMNANGFFTAIWFILLKQQSTVRHRSYLHGHYYLFTHGMMIIHDATYYVHDGFLMPHWTCLAVFLVAPWGSRAPPLSLSNCLSSPSLGGPGPPSVPLPGLTPFPSGSTHSLTPQSNTVTLDTIQWQEWTLSAFQIHLDHLTLLLECM